MKKLFILLLLPLLIIGCAKDGSFGNQYDFEISHEKQKHKISSKTNLMEFVTLITDGTDNTVIDVEFKELSDDDGPFNIILAKHENINTGQYSEIYHVLNLDPMNNKGGSKVSFFVGCSMKCDATFCTSCGLTIHENCKRITCSCGTPINANSACSPNITSY